MTFGEKLKQLRTEKGITQNDLAEKLYVTFQTVSKWENDVNQPDIPTLKKIALFFNCSIDYLLDIDSKSNNQSDKVKCSLCNKEILPNENKHKIARNNPDGSEMTLVLCDSCYSKTHNQNNQSQQSINIFPIGFQNKSQETKSYSQENKSKLNPIEPTINKPKEEKLVPEVKGKHRLSNRDDKVPLIWSIVLGIIALIVVIVVSAVTSNFSGATIGVALGVGYTTTATIYCIFSASYISDVFLEISSWTIKFPGLIFSWDLEGFAWLIGMKILFAVLGFLAGVAVTVLAIAVSAFLSIFSFIPVLISNRRNSF